LAHSIEHAHQVPGIDEIVVSTDSQEIAKVATRWGAGVIMRPPEISGDNSPSEDALRHVLENLGYRPDIVVFLQATNPLRRPSDIVRAIAMVEYEGYDSVLSAVRLHQFVWKMDKERCWSINYEPTGKRPMRQEVAEFVENGSIYVFCTGVLEMYGTRLGGKIGILEMPRWSRIEIDEQEDLEMVAWLMEKRGLK
jgi:N-acylneuraminate cytidylyltransferase